MTDKILSAFNNRNYLEVVNLFTEIADLSTINSLSVTVGHSHRMLGNFKQALHFYMRAIELNKSETRAAFHALTILVKDDFIDVDASIFADVMFGSPNLNYEELSVLAKFCLSRNYKVTLIIYLISNYEEKYKLIYDLSDIFSKKNHAVNDLFSNECFLNFLNVSKSQDVLYFLNSYERVFNKAVPLEFLSYFIENNIINSKHSGELDNSLLALALLDGFRFLDNSTVLNFFLKFDSHLSYPIIHSKFGKGYYSRDFYKLLVKSLKEASSKKEFFLKRTIKNQQKIAIVVPAFLDSKSSYVKFIRDYVISLKKASPDCAVKIFVTDELNLKVFDFYFGYKSSKLFSERHYKLFNENGNNLYSKNIDIWYSYGPNSLNYIDDFKAVISEFSPCCVLTFSAYGSFYFSDYIYSNYPLIFLQTNVKDNPNYDADVYLTFLDDLENVSNNKINPDRWFVQKSPYVSVYTETKIDKINYLGRDFKKVLITVGARLGTELSRAYYNEILKLLYELNQQGLEVCWLIIGSFDRKELIEAAIMLDVNDFLIFKDYENELMSVYSFCDIYLNPMRTGGGISIAYAIMSGLPAICFRGADATPFVGPDMLFDNIDYYIKKICHILSNQENACSILDIQRKLLNDNHSIDSVGSSLTKHIKQAIESYTFRTN